MSYISERLLSCCSILGIFSAWSSCTCLPRYIGATLMAPPSPTEVFANRAGSRLLFISHVIGTMGAEAQEGVIQTDCTTGPRGSRGIVCIWLLSHQKKSKPALGLLMCLDLGDQGSVCLGRLQARHARLSITSILPQILSFEPTPRRRPSTSHPQPSTSPPPRD